MAGGLILLILAVWLFVRTFWGGLARSVAGAVS
jgi:hypothetical protein